MRVIVCGSSLRLPGAAARMSDLVVAWGAAGLYRDGRLVLDGDDPPRGYRDREGYLRFRDCERYARRRPGPSVWEVRVRSPLWDAVWRRARPGRWVVAESGPGFA